jgi:hypothetical protein
MQLIDHLCRARVDGEKCRSMDVQCVFLWFQMYWRAFFIDSKLVIYFSKIYEI